MLSDVRQQSAGQVGQLLVVERHVEPQLQADLDGRALVRELDGLLVRRLARVGLGAGGQLPHGGGQRGDDGLDGHVHLVLDPHREPVGAELLLETAEGLEAELDGAVGRAVRVVETHCDTPSFGWCSSGT